ncbi:MAG: biotin transporter BioY [Candidatus Omnitrophica bacterium]|nr:biotin transporter BioY [Candidatus Omnitrophota bacterium]
MEAILRREIVLNKTFCRAAAVFISVLFISLGAFIRVPLPFTPVPITLQTFFVLLSAAFLGARLGATAQVIYVFLGISGIPLFTGAGNSALYLFGPTGG